jgi:hypothetical protein
MQTLTPPVQALPGSHAVFHQEQYYLLTLLGILKRLTKYVDVHKLKSNVYKQTNASKRFIILNIVKT